MTDAKAAAVRIKVYGLFPTTRRRYVAQVIVAAVLVVLLLAAWWFFHVALRDALLALGVPALGAVVAVWDAGPWIVLALAALQAIEAYFVFRAFARLRPETAPPASPPPQA